MRPRPRCCLRAERAARASLRGRVRLDRPAPHRLDIALTLFVLLGAALLGAERGGQLDGVMEQTSHAGDWLARSVGLGVAVVTVSGATHMSETRILAIAGIDASRSLPLFDVAQAKAKLEADPLVKQASVRKLYPNQVVIEIVERTPYAVWQKDGDVSAIAADGAPIDEVMDSRYADLPFVVGEGANGRVREFVGLLDAMDELKPRVEAGVLVGQRRWNLRLKSGARHQAARRQSASRDRRASHASTAIPDSGKGRDGARLPRSGPRVCAVDRRCGDRVGGSPRGQEGRPAMSLKSLAPRMRQIPARKSAILSVLDIGASKIVCLIARLTPMEPSEALRGRTHRCKVLGHRPSALERRQGRRGGRSSCGGACRAPRCRCG